MSRWNPHGSNRLWAIGRMFGQYLPRILAITLALALSLQLAVTVTPVAYAAASDTAPTAPYEAGSRIAVSSDGDEHDEDDWGATPATLSIIAAAGLQDKLVHYDINAHLWPHISPDDDKKPSEGWHDEMRDSLFNSAYFFGYENPDVFFDDQTQYEESVAHLAAEIEKSTADNKLYIILGGPAEVVYQACKRATKGHEYVSIISHSTWNNQNQANQHPGECHKLADIKNVNTIQIKDQNQDGSTSIFSTQGREGYNAWTWMKNSSNPGLQYVYQRMQDYRPDISDCGMIYYLLTADENGSPDKLKDWFSKQDPNFLTADLRPGPSVDVDKMVSELPELKATVEGGIAAEDLPLPTTVKAVLGDNKTTKQLPVTWACENYDLGEPGVYWFYGTLTMPEDGSVVNPANRQPVIQVTQEAPKGPANITGVKPVASKNVLVGTAEEDLNLPQQVTVILSDDTTKALDVTWSCEDYKADTTGSYTFTGEIALPDDGKVTNIDRVTASMTVNVVEELTVGTPGVFVEYFNEYDRRTDYTVTPAAPAPGSDASITSPSLQGHTGIPAGVPVSWSGISDQISAYWAKGSEVPGTNGPDMEYNGQYVVGTNYFAMRWTADLTTPDFAGDYYFKVNANDGKHFAIYDTAGNLLGEYTRWNGTVGAVNTGTNNVTGEGDTRTGFTLVDTKGDVVKIPLEANTTYRVVMEFCEHKDTAFGKLQWMYDTTDANAISKLGGNNTSGTAHDQYLIPAGCFSIPAELDGNLVQGYVYDTDGTPLSGITVTLGESTYTTGSNGYYRLVTDQKGSQNITYTGDGYSQAVQQVDISAKTTVLPVQLEKGAASPQEKQPGLQAYYYSDTTVDVNGDYSKLIPVTSEIIHSNLNLSWGSSSPHPDLMTSDNFSVIYKGYITVPTTGEYEFKTTSNDGGLLKIDGQQVTLKTGGGGNVTGKITLDAGEHTFYLGMHEAANTASIKVEWKKPGDSALSVVPASVLTCDPLPGAAVRDVTSVGSLAQISVAQGTEVADIKFPTKVSVTLEGNVSATLPVSHWSSNDYTPDVPGTYTFTGALVTNDYITNSQNLNATVEVKVIGARAIASVTTLHASPVLFGTEQADLPLYQNVQVKLEDGTVAYVPVSQWTCQSYDAEKAGTYNFVGTLDASKAFIIEDTMASTPCLVSNTKNLTASLPITVMDQGQKQLVWIISDMSDPNLKGSESTGTVNDPDDVSAMAGYFLMSNEFDTRGIVISSTHRSQHVAGTPDQKEWADSCFGQAYADELANLNANIGGYQDELTFYQSCIKETAEHFDKNKSYADLTNYDTVQALVDEVSSLKDGEILNVLCWGSLTEPAIFVKHCMETGKEELLDHVRFIAHWTNSSLKQGTPEQPWKVANFNEDANAGWYVKDLAFDGAYDYFELGCIGQHGIVSGQPRTNGYYNAFKVSQLGTIFAEGKFTSNGVDHSDSATYWTLLGGYGVDLGDVDPRGSNAAKVEQANIDAFYANSKALHEELLRRAEAAAQEPSTGTEYSITVLTEGSGTVSASLSSAAEGTQITLTAIPDNGCHFKQWQVVSGGVEITDNQFTMPASDVTVKAVFEQDASSGGGSSSGSPSSGATTETEQNPDGSTTTTVTKPDGTTTETTKQPDGSTTQVITKPDGSSTTTVDNADGSSSTTTVSQDGKVESQVNLPLDLVEDAAENHESVTLPIPELPSTQDWASAPVVQVDLPAGRSVKVEIPVNHVTSGTVAVLVDADGKEAILKTSLATENGIAVTLWDGDTVKIVENSKVFSDVSDRYWGSQYIDFAVSRNLFSGTGESTFSPDATMTRAMIVTVLASYDGADTSAAAGEAWYTAGQRWAMEHGISDGSNMNASLTREQLAVMLWNYAGKPAPAGNLPTFSDAEACSDWAAQALAWAVENGLLSGTGSNMLSPQAKATRAQVATILMRYIELTNQ